MRQAILLSIALISFCVNANVVVKTNKNTRQFEISLDGVHQRIKGVEGTNFVEVSLKNVAPYEGILFKVGYPELPALRIPVSGNGEISIKSIGAPVEEKLIDENLLVAPNLKSVARSHRTAPIIRLDQTAYHAASYPGTMNQIDSLGSVRDISQRLISLYPVQYHPETKTLSIQKKWLVTVTGDEPLSDSSLAKPEGILFVVGEKFSESPSLQRFIQHKESLGYLVQFLIVSKEEKKPELIRKRIQDRYREKSFSLNHIIIVGDADDITGAQAPEIDGISDHLYRSLDIDEYEKDIATPDATLGRLAFSNEAELKNYVDRVIRYETGAFWDSSWLNRASLIATDDPVNYPESELTQSVLESILSKFWQIRSDLLFAIQFHSTGEDVVKKIDEGRGLVSYAGHGDVDQWLGPIVTPLMLDKITNTSAIPLVLSHACYTGHFVDNSFAETWLRKPNGAIAFWGSMDIDFWGDGDVFERIVNANLFETPTRNLGEMNLKSVTDFWHRYGGQGHSRYYWEDYVLFGDPTVSFRTRQPSSINLSRIEWRNFDRTRVQFSFSLPSNQNGLENTRVALISPNRTYRQVGYLNKSGMVEFSIPERLNLRNWSLVVSGGTTKLIRYRL